MNPDSLYIQGRVPNPLYRGFTPVNANPGYMDNLYQKQTSSPQLPLLQMYELGMMDKKDLIMMSMLGGNPSNALQLMTTINNIESQKLQAQKYQQQRASSAPYGVSSSLYDALKDIGTQYPDATRVAQPTSTYDIEEDDTTEKTDEKSVEKQDGADNSKESTDKSETTRPGFLTPGQKMATELVKDAVLVPLSAKAVYDYKFNKTSGISVADFKKLKANAKPNSVVSNLAENTKLLKAFDELKPGNATPEQWMKDFKLKLGKKNYSFEELKAFAEKDFKGLKEPEVKKAKAALDKLKVAEDAVEPYKLNAKATNNLAASGKLATNLKAENSALFKDLQSAKDEVGKYEKLMKEAKTKELKAKYQEQYKLANNKFNSASKAVEEKLLTTTKAGIDVAKAQKTIMKSFKGKPDELLTYLHDYMQKPNISAVEKEAAKVLQEKAASSIAAKVSSKDIVSGLLKGTEKEITGLEATAKSISKVAKAGKLTSFLGKAGKVAGPVGYALVAASEGVSIYDIYKKEGHFGTESIKKTIRASVATAASIGASIAAGSATGAAVGAVCGAGVASWITWVPGLIVGAAAGAITYYAADKAVALAADAFVPPSEEDLKVRNS